MLSLKAVKTRFLLVTLSLFFDVAFVDRVWTDPNIMRASIGLIGIFIVGITGATYAFMDVAFSYNIFPVAAILLMIGLILFMAGSLRGRINISFDLGASQETLRSRGTLLCLLTDTRQSSSFIEAIVNETQPLDDENSLKVAECYLIFATEIWRESLAKKGLDLIGEMFTKRNIGEMIARKNNLPAV